MMMSVLSSIECTCPYCGEPCLIVVDPTEVGQELTEDCQVCCRPMRVVTHGAGPDYDVGLYREDE
jgi:hypothetical protein